MKKKITLIVLLLVLVLALSSCKSIERDIKDYKSSWTGLKRTVQVYSQDGKLIKEYEGKIDIEVNDYGNKVKFDVDGKRVIINNAIVIIEEE